LKLKGQAVTDKFARILNDGAQPKELEEDFTANTQLVRRSFSEDGRSQRISWSF